VLERSNKKGYEDNISYAYLSIDDKHIRRMK